MLNHKHTRCLDTSPQTFLPLVRLLVYLNPNTSTPSTYISFSSLIWQQQQSFSGFVLLMGSNLAQMWHSRECWAICDSFLSTQRKYLLHFFILLFFFLPLLQWDNYSWCTLNCHCCSSWNSWFGKTRLDTSKKRCARGNRQSQNAREFITSINKIGTFYIFWLFKMPNWVHLYTLYHKAGEAFLNLR